jgi:predicted dehydrogenase
MPTRPVSRRDLIKTASGAAAALSLPRPLAAQPTPPAPPGASMMGVPFEHREKVRFGLIGCGGRGSGLLRDILGVEGVEVKAVCDVVPDKVARAQAAVTKAGQPAPEGYAKSERHFEELCRRGDLDLVYVATPWNWHVPMAVAALEGGAHAGVEVPAAVTLEDSWRLVDTSERTRRHCVMLENCCYGWSEMLVLNLVRAGMLGELTHAECAYIHDLRSLLFQDRGEGLWRRYEHFRRNGNLYPTHGLGPVAQYLGIHRGDRFERLVSMSSPSLGLQAFRERTLPAGDPKRQETYACGDMNTSLLRTARGRTVVLQHDVVSPRPYSRINMVSGTKGTFADYPPRVFFDGQKDEEEWQELRQEEGRPPGGIEDRYEDPLWKKLAKTAEESGHGGMDYVMSYRLVECLREGLAPDMDVYDAAAWSAPAALSEQSVAGGSVPVEFPDFTRGRWAGRGA